ncbi:MAG: hypothetical protein AAGF12_03480 [Myxococcota bacterium]
MAEGKRIRIELGGKLVAAREAVIAWNVRRVTRDHAKGGDDPHEAVACVRFATR